MTNASSSPSSSASSYSSSSYTNVAPSRGSDNSLSASCIPKILRRLVCGSSLYIQPSDFTEEADGFDDFRSQDKVCQPKINASSSSSSPGLVARLMGLEAMPEFPRTAPESIRRSRSVNSLFSWAEIHPEHRGVRASTSFREVPTFLRQENQDFLLLSFGTDGREESLAMGVKGRKSELGFGEVKERRVDRSRGMPKDGQREKRSKVSEARNCDKPSRKARECINLNSERRPRKNETDRKQRRSLPIAVEERSQKHRHLKEMTDGAEPVKKKKNHRKKLDSAAKKTESDCSSENSSPVSVLDRPFDVDSDFLVDCDSHKSGRLRSSLLNSRRKLSSGLPNFEYPFWQICCNSASSKAEIKSSEEEGDVQLIQSHRGLCSSELWHEICRLAEEDAKNANWVIKIGSRTEEFQAIGVEFSVRILDGILQEAIDELAEHPQHQIL